MAQIILTQLQQALRAVMAAGSEAFGDGMEETGDASRQIALMQSLAMMVGKMAEGIQQEDALAHWARQLLQMLEDGTAAVEVEDKARARFYKAVGSMQALLGVSEDGRAWVETPQDDEATALRLQDARELLKPARALVPVFLHVLSTTDLPEVDSVCLAALAERLSAALEAAEGAPTANAYVEGIVSAADILGAMTRQMQSAPDVLWGLTAGIDSTLIDASMQDKDGTAARYGAVAAGDAQALTDLSGELGERAQIIRECACEMLQTAEVLIDRVRDSDPQELSLPYRHMLKRMEVLSGISLSAVDDHMETVPKLREAMA